MIQMMNDAEHTESLRSERQGSTTAMIALNSPSIVFQLPAAPS